MSFLVEGIRGHFYGYGPQRTGWFSHDVTKIQSTKLSIILRFYFHDALEQLKIIFVQIFASKVFLVL